MERGDRAAAGTAADVPPAGAPVGDSAGRSGPDTALAALRSPRYLIGLWPWRALVYTATTPPAAFAAGAPLGFAAVPAAAAAGLLIGAWSASPGRIAAALALLAFGAAVLAAAAPLVAQPFGALERLRLHLADRRPCPSPHRPPQRPGILPWLRARYGSAAVWSECAYAVLTVLLFAPLALAVLGMLAVGLVLCTAPLIAASGQGPIAFGPWQVDEAAGAAALAAAGAAAVAAALYAAGLAAGGHAAAARALLGPSGAAAARAELTEVARSRERLVDAFEAERRRIERDLHDGAQQRLVALSMRLGLARLDLTADGAADRQVAEAQELAKSAIAELRELVAGIHPKVLSDRGLPAALPELADRCPVPAAVRVALDERPTPAIEAAVYFTVAEALTNVAKHSGADRAEVGVRLDGRGAGRRLIAEVRDDGAGGADAAHGTGLTGLADRIAVVGGRMLLSSPSGGPTVVQVEVPWRTT
ncbi:sensor histidine kinase [Nocardiopsis coralliicola]